MLVLIRGAGDIATGIALRLHRSGPARGHDRPRPAPRPSAAPSASPPRIADWRGHGRGRDGAVYAPVHGRAGGGNISSAGREIPVLADPAAAPAATRCGPTRSSTRFSPSATSAPASADAPVVVGVGPGFTAGEDCHAVVETMRGHTLGRVIYRGSALPNTNIPGLIGGYRRRARPARPGGRRVSPAAAGHRRARWRPGDVAGDGGAASPCAAPLTASCAGILPERDAGTHGHEIRRRRPPLPAGILLSPPRTRRWPSAAACWRRSCT